MQTAKLYCDVARHRSISRAAAEYGITQSAVSQRISQLEKRLGVTLLDRSVRPLELTAAGQVYLQGCLDLLERNERLESTVSQIQLVEGNVRVDAIYSAGIDLLNHVKQHFASAHPRVTVTVNYKRPEAVYEETRQGRCDIGIVSYPQKWRHVSVIPLRDERMSVVCQPDHPLSQQLKVNAVQLAEWPMVMFERQLPVGRHIRKYLREHGVTPQVDSVFDNLDTIKSALAVTKLVSILPRRTVLREMEAGTLAAVELEPVLVRPMGIIDGRRTGSVNGFSPAVQIFVNILLEHAGPDVEPLVPAGPVAKPVGSSQI